MVNEMQGRLLNSGAGQEGELKGRVFEESKKIWRVALPSLISRVASFGTVVVTQSFIGHIGAVNLASYALVQTLGVRFVNGILIGMSSATETLCGQAFGAKQYHMMGIFLQRSWLVDLVTLTILLPLFLFASPIFKLLGEEEAIAKSAGYIALWFIPYCYGLFVVHIPLSWAFVYVLNGGVTGAMAALCISSWIPVFGEFVYVFGGWCPDSWTGFTVAALKDIFPVVKFSISSGLMICVQLWYNAILVLVAGYMKNAEVAISAFSVCLNINGWEFMVCLGILGAACVRVANELGRGNAKVVKFSIKVLLTTSVIIGVTFWILCLVFGNKLGYLFSNEEEVVKSVSDLSILLAFSMLFNSIYPVFSGSFFVLSFPIVDLRVRFDLLISDIFHPSDALFSSSGVAIGAGMQATVAIVNIVCFYLIGLPVGLVLGYVAHLQVKGLWIGMLCGVVTETLALSFMMWRTNWDEEVLKASARLKKWYLKAPVEAN
ncbi:hypothetical protein BUALT_Bualt12G0046900 [Buddleja alternifolia]|uniref:Protein DETOXIFICATION n=1 Tax=Buddleja alternifolia TaxID=168488 RepID=A0AAV6WZ45_9LAMI|nr:hypothetical protein BUALT_Bualt12G0046900 [Buddleja alternifolia]